MLDAALSSATRRFFDNTGPTGQRAMKAMDAKFTPTVAAGLAADVVERSQRYGRALARLRQRLGRRRRPQRDRQHGLSARIQAERRPRTLEADQHHRPAADAAAARLGRRPHLRHADGRDLRPAAAARRSAPTRIPTFYKQAQEVDDDVAHLTPEQKAIARFWSDDPMLSTTPPGHWIQIALQISDRVNLPIDRRVDLLARLGVATADAFIGCWQTKFEYDTVRPVTYIRANIDPHFAPLLITPPFPGISERPFDAVGRGRDGADASLRRQLRLSRTPRMFATACRRASSRASGRRPRRRRSRALYGGIHFRCGDRARARPGTLRRPLRQRAEDPANDASASPLLALALAAARRARAPTTRRRRISSTRPPPRGLHASYDGEWQYMVGGGVAAFDCARRRPAERADRRRRERGEILPQRVAAGGAPKFEHAAERARTRQPSSAPIRSTSTATARSISSCCGSAKST